MIRYTIKIQDKLNVFSLTMKIIYLFSIIFLAAVAGEAGHNAEDNGIAKSCYFESDVVMSWNEAAEEYYSLNPKL